MATTKSYVKYSITTATAALSIPFPFADPSHISVATPPTWAGTWAINTALMQVQFVPAVTSGEVLIRRNTPAELLHIFVNLARFNFRAVDDNFTRCLYWFQEARDAAELTDAAAVAADLAAVRADVASLGDTLSTVEESAERALKLPVGSSASTAVPAPVASRLLGWDSVAGALANIEQSAENTTASDTSGRWVTVAGFMAYLISGLGAGLVGFVQLGSTIVRTVRLKLQEAPSLADFPDLQTAVNQCANKTLRIPAGTYTLPNTPVFITAPIVIEGDSQATTLFLKSAGVTAFKVLSSNVQIRRLTVTGNVPGDTSNGIQIGQNDGVNGQGTGYISAAQCVLDSVLLVGCGARGVDWEEGPFAEFRGVHSFNNGINYYVSPAAFDASHGTWYSNSAGATGDGYYIGWGVHVFQHAKSFSDAGRGMFLNNSRGSTGNIFVELSGGACLSLGANTLACQLNVQFWTAGKNYVDAGIGNCITGMSLGNNSGDYHASFVRTNQLLVKREFVASGTAVANGGLLIAQTGDTTYDLGDTAYTCKLQARSGGVLLQGVAVGHKVYDLSGSGSTNALNSSNQHIDNWLLSNGQTLQLNGASGTAYTPYDGQTVTVWLKGSGTASIYGAIAGAIQTITITTTNTSKTFMWMAAQGYWFQKS